MKTSNCYQGIVFLPAIKKYGVKIGDGPDRLQLFETLQQAMDARDAAASMPTTHPAHRVEWWAE